MYIEPNVIIEKTFAKSRNISDESPMDIPVFVARPKDEEPITRPGLLLFQEAFGVNSHIRDVCQRYARQGYVVVAPDMYHRTGQWQEFDYKDFAATAPAREALTTELILGDIEATLDFLVQLDGVDAQRIGALGYCMGGRLTYLTASSFPERIQAAAVYYGGGIVQPDGSGIIDKTNQIQAPIIGFFGGEDKGIPQNAVEEIDKALSDAHVKHEIYFYPGAGHGFCCDARPSFHPVASQDAWCKTLKWFQSYLGKVPTVDWE